MVYFHRPIFKIKSPPRYVVQRLEMCLLKIHHLSLPSLSHKNEIAIVIIASAYISRPAFVAVLLAEFETPLGATLYT